MVESFNSSHVNAVTQLHLRSLTGLLRDLGSRAVAAYYHGAARSSCAIGYVYMHEGHLVGFVLGSANPRKLRSEIFANSFLQTLIGTSIGVMRNPGTLRYLLSSLLPGGEDYDPQAAELTYLAVDQNQRSSGIGKQLVEQFGETLSESGVTAYELSVDADNNNAARFYERLGFAEVKRYREFGIEHTRYRMELA